MQDTNFSAELGFNKEGTTETAAYLLVVLDNHREYSRNVQCHEGMLYSFK